MPGKTNIEWTETTWNPVTGCDKVSQGCKNCYAERMSKRLKAMGNRRYIDGFKVTLQHDLIDAPRKWKKSRLIFVNSMSDLFHKDIPFDFIQQVFKTMNETPQHTYQILTKRTERLKELSPHLNWSKNIWMGTSVENVEVTFRIEDLKTIPAYVRFLSCEPLIGPLNNLKLDDIQWVIVGGESGPRARPMKEEWVINIRDSCQEQNIPFFFKQWGGVQKSKHGRVLENKIYNEYPKK